MQKYFQWTYYLNKSHLSPIFALWNTLALNLGSEADRYSIASRLHPKFLGKNKKNGKESKENMNVTTIYLGYWSHSHCQDYSIIILIKIIFLQICLNFWSKF